MVCRRYLRCFEAHRVWVTPSSDSTVQRAFAGNLLPGAKNADVIVVGAGLPGLVAASEGQRSGWVVLLEAKYRAGGRSYSFPFQNGSITEFGATWIC